MKKALLFLSMVVAIIFTTACSKENEDKIQNSDSKEAFIEKTKIFDKDNKHFVEITIESTDKNKVDSLLLYYKNIELIVERKTNFKDLLLNNENSSRDMTFEEEGYKGEYKSEDTSNLIILLNPSDVLKTKKDGEALSLGFKAKGSQTKAYSIPFNNVSGTPAQLKITGGVGCDIIQIMNLTSYFWLGCLCNEQYSNWTISGDKGSSHIIYFNSYATSFYAFENEKIISVMGYGGRDTLLKTAAANILLIFL